MRSDEYKSNRPDFEEIAETGVSEGRHLILHNDDVHSFDYVINTLIEVCDMEPVQAEQCTYLVHYKGQCDVKSGAYEILKPYKQGLIERELNATID